MLISEYYEILGLPLNSSLVEIKKAYRKKARLYHPDINHSQDAKEKFIKATEAYDFLVASKEKEGLDDEDYFRIVEEWRKYRQDRTRQRAQYYARSSFAHFKNSKYYRSTNILNASSVIFNFAIAVLVLTFTIFGYILKLKNPVPGEERQNLLAFILLLTISLILLAVAFIYLRAFLETRKKYKGKK
jgi:curved DNA-binding protein CbpA